VNSPSYAESILDWRRKLEVSLRGDESWLALAGLFWLREGENSVGTDPANDVALPAGSAPERVGWVGLEGGRATLRIAPGVEAVVEGKPIRQVQMTPDGDGSPTRVRVGSVTMVVIRRGKRWGLRVWDRNNPVRESFPGRDWYPIDEAYRVEARFFAYVPPRMLPIRNILGDIEEFPCPGTVVFTLAGQECRLQASEGDEQGLFFIFQDGTSGITTYPGGRFLVGEPPREGSVILDFNRAYNPPCAFTPYATCPLPPEGNSLPQRIEAGERHESAAQHRGPGEEEPPVDHHGPETRRTE
jgi:uncharacterized protein (DUF1684 family)